MTRGSESINCGSQREGNLRGAPRAWVDSREKGGKMFAILKRRVMATPCGRILCFCAALGPLSAAARAEVAFTVQRGATIDAFDGVISNDDLIQGQATLDVDVYENPFDSFGNQSNIGWHPVNTNPADQLAAFTDGIGMRDTGLTGLLNDFPPASGSPTKIVQYPLASPSDIGRINILTGNNNPDGRIFSTTYIEYSTDNGFTFEPLGYFQSDPSGTGNTTDRTTLVSIFDNSSATMLSGVTDLVFNLYSVSNTASGIQDPFDGTNPFTGLDDELARAFESPLVLEIDVLPPSQGLPGDYNQDGSVDAADYVTWRKTGIDGQSGYETWRTNFGTMQGFGGGIAATPEPGALFFLAATLAAATLRRKCR